MTKQSRAHVFGFLILFLVGALLVSCSSTRYPTQNLKISRSLPTPAQFFTVEGYDAGSITIAIRIKFAQATLYLYHILSDAQDNFIAEGWFPTAKDSSGCYSVTMKTNKGFTFAPGQKILLCIGKKHPKEYRYRSNVYQCLTNIWLTLE